MLRDAPNLNHLAAGLVIEEVIRCGVSWFCVCPGSRSAPLAWAVAAHPKAQSMVHHDERGAAYHALGIAKSTGNPAAFVCTSGTAAANAFPAVIESRQSGVPLLILTADRPQELQDAGANQTIDQIKLFGGYPNWQCTMAPSREPMSDRALLTTMDHAVHRCLTPNPGPVHLNFRFDEPLAPTRDWDASVAASRLDALGGWLDSEQPFTQILAPEITPGPEDIRDLADRLATSRRTLLVVGQLASPAERDAVRRFSDRLGRPTIADVTSGLRLDSSLANVLPYGVHAASRLVSGADTVVHVGGPVVSRKLADALATIGHDTGEGKAYVRIHSSFDRLDPAHNVSLRVQASLPRLLPALTELLPPATPPDAWEDRARKLDSLASEVVGEWIRETADAVTEIGIVRTVTRAARQTDTLFLGNSMPIRDADLFGANDGQGPWVAANRGASGIDGNIATAAGHTRATGRSVTAILGDLAALHDLNSLALLRDASAPLVLVILNNDGGGIFHLLPIAEHEEHFERFFGTPHGRNFADAASMFDLPYHAPESPAAFEKTYLEALDAGRSCIIEIRSDRRENRELHAELDARIQAALDTV